VKLIYQFLVMAMPPRSIIQGAKISYWQLMVENDPERRNNGPFRERFGLWRE